MFIILCNDRFISFRKVDKGVYIADAGATCIIKLSQCV